MDLSPRTRLISPPQEAPRALVVSIAGHPGGLMPWLLALTLSASALIGCSTPTPSPTIVECRFTSGPDICATPPP
jgi:hypothetical protein